MICTGQFSGFSSAILEHATSEETADRLRGIARPLCATKGSSAKLDAQHDQLVFVDSGAAKLVAHASVGREQVVSFHFAGDLITIPAHDTHAYSLCALNDIQLVTFPQAEFMAIVSKDAGVLAKVLEHTMDSLHRSRDKALALGRKTARERVAGFLTTMAERIGTSENDGYRIELPMSRRDIGDSLGLTIETVSRQFSEMRGDGLVETSGRSAVRLVDCVALADRAGHNPASA